VRRAAGNAIVAMALNRDKYQCHRPGAGRARIDDIARAQGSGASPALAIDQRRFT
jgi:hypothetical protein